MGIDLSVMERRHTDGSSGVVATYKSVIKTPTVDMDNRLIQGVVTTDSVDMDGEVVVPGGIDTTYFTGADDASGVRTVYYDHDYSRPIGTCRNMKATDEGIYAVTYIAKTAFGDELLTMVNEGIVRGQSIGFRRMDSGNPTFEETAKYGSDCKRVTRKSLMLEYSIVAMPCNPDAMLTLKNLVGKRKISERTAALVVPTQPVQRPRIIVAPGGCYSVS